MIRNLWLYLVHLKLALLLWLKPLGFFGVCVLGAIDASSVAIPMDPIIAVYVWGNRKDFWLYAIMGALGAAVGALVPFYIGRTGGEWVLHKRVKQSKYDQLRARFDRHQWLAVLVPAALPPPFPFKVFAFGAGVFEMRLFPYILSVFLGRTAHYLVTALLTVYFGPEILNLIRRGAKGHAHLIMIGFAILATAFLLYEIYRRRRKHRNRNKEAPGQ